MCELESGFRIFATTSVVSGKRGRLSKRLTLRHPVMKLVARVNVLVAIALRVFPISGFLFRRPMVSLLSSLRLFVS